MIATNTISKYSQLISEGLLFYFILVPLLALYEYSLPLWNYLVMILLSIFVCTISNKFIQNYSVYIINGILLVAISWFLLMFPFWVGVIIALFMIWRSIEHEKTPDMQNQAILMIVTLFFFLFDALFFYGTHLVALAICILTILIGGSQISHIIAIQNYLWKKSFLYVVGVIFVSFMGSGLLYLCYPLIDLLLHLVGFVIGHILLFFVSIIAYILSFTGINLDTIREWIEYKMTSNIQMDFSTITTPPQQDAASNQAVGETSFSLWLLLMVGAVLIGITMLLAKKKIQKPMNRENKSSGKIDSTTKQETDNNKKGFFSSVNKPNNEIRLKVLHFEQAAFKAGFGREPYETIEEWFTRLDIDPSYLDLYQKVRYGNKDLTHSQISTFNNQLEQMKELLKKQVISNSGKNDSID